MQGKQLEVLWTSLHLVGCGCFVSKSRHDEPAIAEVEVDIGSRKASARFTDDLSSLLVDNGLLWSVMQGWRERELDDLQLATLGIKAALQNSECSS